MELVDRISDETHVLELSGRFDAFEVPTVNKWFDAHPDAKNVIVNLNGVGFIDSSGLAALVKGLKRCRQNGGELCLCSLQQAVLIIFELTRLDKAFTIYETEEAAIEALKG